MTRTLRARLLGSACALLAAGAARAHPQSLSYLEIAVQGDRAQVQLRFAAADLAPLLAADGKLAEPDVARLGPALPATLFRELRLRASGADCAGEDFSAAWEKPDGILLRATWRCPGEIEELEVREGYLDQLAPGHTDLAKITFPGDGAVFQRVSAQGSETFSVTRARTPLRTGLRFLRLGISHIFAGYDHIAFLLGLLLLGGRLRTLLGIVTSFTVAHSVTLALAALGLFAPPPRLIEPLIAASIVFVALENLWALRARAGDRPELAARALGHRWMVTFAFGLVHGFGFAGALRELHLPRAELAASLVSFNLGVEVGQVAIVAVALPLLALLRRKPWFATAGLRALSAAVGAAGLFWLVQRVAGL